jgi:hypothetical protein
LLLRDQRCRHTDSKLCEFNICNDKNRVRAILSLGCCRCLTYGKCPTVEVSALLEVHQAALEGVDCRLGTIASAHLVEYGADVDAYRLLRYVKIFCDLAVT